MPDEPGERDPFTAFVGSEPRMWREGPMAAWTPVGGGPERKRVMPLALLPRWIEAAQRLLDDARDAGVVLPFARPGAPGREESGVVRFGEPQAAFDAGWPSRQPRRALPPREGLKLRLDAAAEVHVGDDKHFHVRVAGPDGVVEIVYAPYAGFAYARRWQRALAEWQRRNGPIDGSGEQGEGI